MEDLRCARGRGLCQRAEAVAPLLSPSPRSRGEGPDRGMRGRHELAKTSAAPHPAAARPPSPRKRGEERKSDLGPQPCSFNPTRDRLRGASKKSARGPHPQKCHPSPSTTPSPARSSSASTPAAPTPTPCCGRQAAGRRGQGQGADHAPRSRRRHFGRGRCGAGQGRASTPAAIKLVSMSTTLATNALVEGQGGRVALIMIGFSEADLARDGLKAALGTDPVLFCRRRPRRARQCRQARPRGAGGSAARARRRRVSGFAVCAYFATRNPAHEIAARDLIREKTGLPVTASHELSAKLGGPRRALTTLLNARLISMIDRLVAATEGFLEQRGIAAPLMVVRGDGALVSAAFARAAADRDDPVRPGRQPGRRPPHDRPRRCRGLRHRRHHHRRRRARQGPAAARPGRRHRRRLPHHGRGRRHAHLRARRRFRSGAGRWRARRRRSCSGRAALVPLALAGMVAWRCRHRRAGAAAAQRPIPAAWTAASRCAPACRSGSRPA